MSTIYKIEEGKLVRVEEAVGDLFSKMESKILINPELEKDMLSDGKFELKVFSYVEDVIRNTKSEKADRIRLLGSKHDGNLFVSLEWDANRTFPGGDFLKLALKDKTYMSLSVKKEKTSFIAFNYYKKI